MRIGNNPQKKESKLELKTNHRVVMVIFIPELSGYYEGMLEVIKVSIASLIKTLPPSSAITLVDNGSCKEVRDYLISLFEEKAIDSLQLLATNIGKIDAMMGAARAAREPIITLTDCDILFKAGWVTETIKVFNAFSGVGSVSPIPPRTALTYYTFATQQAILRQKLVLSFEAIPGNFEEYNRFLASINWDKENDANKLWPIIIKDGHKAIVGSDHQVLTLRRDIFFNATPVKPSLTKLGKESVREYVDLPIDLSDGLRLSTYNFYAAHIGNRVEPWMLKQVEELNGELISLGLKLEPELSYIKKNQIWYKLKKKVLKKVFKLKIVAGYQ